MVFWSHWKGYHYSIKTGIQRWSNSHCCIPVLTEFTFECLTEFKFIHCSNKNQCTLCSKLNACKCCHLGLCPDPGPAILTPKFRYPIRWKMFIQSFRNMERDCMERNYMEGDYTEKDYMERDYMQRNCMERDYVGNEWTFDRRELKGHPFMTSTRRGEGVRLRWTHVDGGRGVQPHVDVHTEN